MSERSDPLREFAENLVDDLRIAEIVKARDAADSGERIELDDLIRALGFDPAALPSGEKQPQP